MSEKIKSCYNKIQTFSWKDISAERKFFWFLLVLAAVERLGSLGVVPVGLNQDEAYAGYNAWSMVTAGVDSRGDAFPVYFEAWGSGMNVLNSYLMMPFIALFGLQIWVIRLPQAIVGLLTVPTVYAIVKRLSDEKKALAAMAFVSIAPWHIMMSRWGLESNLAPGFVMFGLYFFLLGMEKPKFFLLSGLFYGLSLYAYATIWPFVPLMILLEVLYAMYTGNLKISKYLILGGVILAFFALPLMLFLLVNQDILPEMKWLGIFTIPRMSHLRDNEISLANIPQNFKQFMNVLRNQSDGLHWNATDDYGLWYKFTSALVIIGLLLYLRGAVISIREKRFSLETIILIQFLGGFLIGITIYVNVNRMNIIYLPILIMMSTGFYMLCEHFPAKKYLLTAVCCVLVFSLLQFNTYYFGEDYTSDSSWCFMVGLEEALDAADAVADSTGATVYIPEERSYPAILFHKQIPVSTYYEVNEAGANFSDLGRYQRNYDTENPDPAGIYIINQWEDRSAFSDEIFYTTQYGAYFVMVPRS